MVLRRLLLAALLLPVIACAQFDFGGGQTTNKPWESFKLNPKTKIALNFKNANVDAVIGLLSKTSGITIVKDPALTGAITVTSAKPVALNDAFQILATTLKLKGYDMSKEGNLLVIRGQKQQSGRPQFDMSQFSRENDSPRTELKVYYIKYANASQVARVINDVFAGGDSNQNNNRFGGGRFGGRGGNNNFDRQMIQRMMEGNNTQTQVRASSDDFSNSVIVNAPGSMQEQVSSLISKLDKQSEDPQTAQVYHLEFATASELAPTIQNLLTSNAPKGRGGISNQNVPIEQRFQQMFRFGSSSAAFGTVVADDRTNSLVVTATPDNQELVAKVIGELDTEVKVENTTFVFPLNNARATDIADLMQQAFGTRQGFNGGGNRNNNNNARNRFNNNGNNNRGGGNNNFGGGGGGGFGGGGREASAVDPDGKNLDLALEDPNADSGDLMTMVGVGQGRGFNRFFGGGQGQNQNNGQTARDSQGRMINVRDLQGQITVIPDPNTNSLIVVTTPDNVQMIQSILDQLDRIPEQVMIETMIIEATLDSSNSFGVEWNLVQNKVLGNKGVTGSAGSDFGLGKANPPLEGFKYTLTGGDLGVFLNALKTDTKFQVLSTPRIFTSNNNQAEINISQRVPYVVSTREDSNGNLTFNYSFQDVGIVLNVTPHITANGYVTMDIDQTANDLQGFTSFNAPIVNQREANTSVSVKDGETIILGGIIRNNVTSTVKKIPLLGDIPILGNLFKSSSKQNVKTELMVFLTPRVVRNPDDAQKLREDTQKTLSGPTQKTLKNAIPPTGGDGHKAPPTGGG